MHRCRFDLIALSLVTASIIVLFSGTARAADPAPDRYVVMISVDGLAGFYFDDPKAEMPNIRAMATDGARAASMRASVPSVTWPNHTSLVTGVTPAKHGVVGNNFYDRVERKPVALISDPVLDKDQIVKVPTLYDLAHDAGMKTLAIRWPAARNARSLDWNVPDMKLAKVEAFSTPALVSDAKAANLWPKGVGGADPAAEAPAVFSDAASTSLFLHAFEKHKPRFSLLHIADVDHTEHLHGPRSVAAYSAIKAADEQVGRVWTELKRIVPGKATILVVSDHGFSPINKVILPNVVLRKAGLIEAKGSGLKVTGGKVAVVVQGGSAMIYIHDPADRAEVTATIKKAFADVEDVATVVDTEHLKDYGVADPTTDPHAPDMILFVKEGCAFGDTVAGSMTFQEKPERRGTHGHDINLPNLHATFVGWGSGIKPGAKLETIQNIDVAPTAATLLGLPTKGMDGKVLSDALAK